MYNIETIDTYDRSQHEWEPDKDAAYAKFRQEIEKKLKAYERSNSNGSVVLRSFESPIAPYRLATFMVGPVVRDAGEDACL